MNQFENNSHQITIKRTQKQFASNTFSPTRPSTELPNCRRHLRIAKQLSSSTRGRRRLTADYFLFFFIQVLTMAVGKNKGLSKGGKKGSKKKVIDPFSRKEWYDIKAPNIFTNRQVGKTLVNRTQGTKIASEGLKKRVFEVSLADLQNDTDAERSFRKFRLISEEVQGSHVLCNFAGMDLTTDKLR